MEIVGFIIEIVMLLTGVAVRSAVLIALAIVLLIATIAPGSMVTGPDTVHDIVISTGGLR